MKRINSLFIGLVNRGLVVDMFPTTAEVDKFPITYVSNSIDTTRSSAGTSVNEARVDYGGPCKARPRSRADGDD